VARSVQGELPPEVVLGPSAGEDAALVKIGGELWAVASDPISFTAANAGRLVVTVNANDVAVRGAVPRFFLAVVLVAPSDAHEHAVDRLLGEIRDCCDQVGVALIGGHTEVTPDLPHSIVVGTMLGRVEGRPITTGGLGEGDLIGISKWIGAEGTSILLADFGERLRGIDGESGFQGCEEVMDSNWLSVVPEALLAASNPGVTALHDVTEGGIGEGIREMELASGLHIAVDRGRIPMLGVTEQICDALGMDPLGLIGSGALLIGCNPDAASGLETDLDDSAIPFAWIGSVAAEQPLPQRTIPRFERDEILKAWCLAGIDAVVFDMDGTLIDSKYDWPEIRRRLAVTSDSIIDELNGLPDPERTEKWSELEAIERQATLSAALKDGANELLELLRKHGLATALVTNNSDHNTHLLLDRFNLEFDVVLTRDSGLWKPSGAPLAKAMEHLGVLPERCLAVGDSRYDVEAAHEAGCGCVCVLYGAADRYRDHADLAFPDISAFLRYLRIVLQNPGT
jgi:HAD superfamily hydrolase (TIGR01509 family)